MSRNLEPKEVVQLADVVLKLLATFDPTPCDVCHILYSTLSLLSFDPDEQTAQRKLNRCMKEINDLHQAILPSNPTNTSLN